MSASEIPGLARRVVRVTALLVVAQAIALFVAAGSLAFTGAWVHLAIQALTMSATSAYLLRDDPRLLERRLASEETGERDPVQRGVLRFMRVASLAMLVIAGIEWRIGHGVPLPTTALGVALELLGAWIVFRVFRESTYTSSVIEIAPGQHVVSTGPYRFVRHPMYLGVMVTGMGMPLVLGAPWAAAMIVPMFAALAVRIRHEERFLRAELPGYDAYTRRTRARLVPGFW